MQELLGNDSKTCPEEENVEAICQFFNTIGKQLDENPKARRVNDVYFSRLKELTTNPHLEPRCRFMVRDVLDLRANSWVPRREEVNFPCTPYFSSLVYCFGGGGTRVKAKTISEIHSEAEKNLGLRPGATAVMRNGRNATGGVGPGGFPIGRPGSGGMMPGMPGMMKMPGMPGLDADNWEVPRSRAMPRGNSFGPTQVAGNVPTSLINKSPPLNARLLPQGSGGVIAGKPSLLLQGSGAPSRPGFGTELNLQVKLLSLPLQLCQQVPACAFSLRSLLLLLQARDIGTGCLLYGSSLDDIGIDSPKAPNNFGEILWSLVVAQGLDFETAMLNMYRSHGCVADACELFEKMPVKDIVMGIYLSSPKTEKFSEDGENGRLRYGLSSMQGWRATMEDAHAAITDLDATTSFFGVYDGHGGKVVAKFCAKYLHRQVCKNEAYAAGDMGTSVQKAFFRMDEMMRGQRGWRELAALGDKITKFTGMIEGLIWSPRGGDCHEQPDDWAFEEGPHSDFSGPTSGSTACVAIIRNNHLIVANAGDSRCVISRKGQAYNLSRDHKPELEAEKERILKAGGFIHAGRVNGSLNLSRAIGDVEFKQNKFLPVEKQVVELCDDDDFLVLACDGIWDCMSSQQLVDFIHEQLHSETSKMQENKLSAVCERVFDRCLAPSTAGGEGCDNMTMIVVQFKKPVGSPASADEQSSLSEPADTESKPEES
ncbi:hypothetical protein NC653_039052 [Populus alba x Populus x berolinensis]|uniref:protein-serine/threonine phosphatase n=1 Tax=Populus alba x Populus x berolinensis TaxID=444605 RepID=A0AAD6PQ26_9ROSI|nr:hypothetical protein NC653_039052 [Populus alba x Populus x berolinensis]